MTAIERLSHTRPTRCEERGLRITTLRAVPLPAPQEGQRIDPLAALAVDLEMQVVAEAAAGAADAAHAPAALDLLDGVHGRRRLEVEVIVGALAARPAQLDVVAAAAVGAGRDAPAVLDGAHRGARGGEDVLATVHVVAAVVAEPRDGVAVAVRADDGEQGPALGGRAGAAAALGGAALPGLLGALGAPGVGVGAVQRRGDVR